MIQKIDNQQGCNLLTNSQKQVILSGILGDGYVGIFSTGKGEFYTNCIHKEYIEYKKNLLGGISSDIYEEINQGFKQNVIYSVRVTRMTGIKELYDLTLEEKLNQLDDLGLALWLYDDGSLHKKNGFFNLNTHSFTEYEHSKYLIPYFEKLGTKPQIFRDKKKDGREFCYLYFGRHFGAFEIMQVLSKYPINCYNYKLWSSETIQKWSKLQAELKSRDMEITPRKFANILNGVSSI